MWNFNDKLLITSFNKKEGNLANKILKYLINKLFLWPNFSKSSYLVKLIPT